MWLSLWLSLWLCVARLAPGSTAGFTPSVGRWQHVFEAGEDGVAAFRIPGVVSLEAVSDVLIVVAEARLFTWEDISPCVLF